MHPTSSTASHQRGGSTSSGVFPSLILAFLICAALHVFFFKSSSPNNNSSHHRDSSSQQQHRQRQDDSAKKTTTTTTTTNTLPKLHAFHVRPPFSTLSTVRRLTAVPQGRQALEVVPTLPGWSHKIFKGGHQRHFFGSASSRCIGWKQTGGCSVDGPREPHLDRGCAAEIEPSGVSGYCDCGGGVRAAALSCPTVVAEGADAEAVGDQMPPPFTCEDMCDKEVVAPRLLASVAARSAVSSDSRRRLLRDRHRRRQDRLALVYSSDALRSFAEEQRLREMLSRNRKNNNNNNDDAGGDSSNNNNNNERQRRVCVGGFVATVPARCGSVESALAFWRKSSSAQKTAMTSSFCSEPIQPRVSGVCFCSDGVMAAVSCDRRRGGGGGGGGDDVLTCEDACTSSSRRKGVTFYVSPTAGARIGLGISDFQAVMLTPAVSLERMEVQRRSEKLKLIESHIPVSRGARASSDDPDDSIFVVKPRRRGENDEDGHGDEEEEAGDDAQLADVERHAAAQAQLVRMIRKDAMSHHNFYDSNHLALMLKQQRQALLTRKEKAGRQQEQEQNQQPTQQKPVVIDMMDQVVGGGHAGSRQDAAFDADVARSVDAVARKRDEKLHMVPV